MDGSKSKWGFGEFLAVVLLVTVFTMFFWPGSGAGLGDLVPRGTPFPELITAGWLNSPTPLTPELKGNVVVLDCWATWCGPCRAEMPRLAKIYSQYHDRGVKFVGLTPEGEADRAAIQEYMATVPGFDWPVGYGADPMLDMLGISVLPTMVVFDRAGRAVWSNTSTRGMEPVLDELLAR